MRRFVSVIGTAALVAGVVAVASMTDHTGAASVPVAAKAVPAPNVTQATAPIRDSRVEVVQPVTDKAPATTVHAARPAATHAPTKPKHVAAPAHSVTPAAVSGPTSWPALNAAIARIPTYHSGWAHWVVRNTGWWGTADWDTGVIYVSPTVPENKLYDVAVHEWSHILSVRDYGGDVVRAVTAMQLYFSGHTSMTDVMPAEDAADCMAIVQGATWTKYTSCSSAKWRAGAQALVAGHRLPGITV